MRILLAEDDARVRSYIADELECAGAMVTQASDGMEALRFLEGVRYDLLVTDVRMPRLDGWTLAERARSLWADLPVLYVSAWSDVHPRPVNGAVVLNKPFRPAELIEHAVAAAEVSLQ